MNDHVFVYLFSYFNDIEDYYDDDGGMNHWHTPLVSVVPAGQLLTQAYAVLTGVGQLMKQTLLM